MSTLQQRRRRFAFTSASGLILVALAIILINALGNWAYLRFDLTGSRAYSLSSSSKRLVKGLEDRVIIKAYFSPELPQPYNSNERYVRDMLTEYRAASHGKVRYEFIPTTPTKDFEQKAVEAGMAPIQFEQMGSDQLAIRRGFMGLVIFYKDKSEAMPVLKDLPTLEYDLTSRIAKMANTQKKVIAVTTGYGENDLRSPNSKLTADLNQLYEIKNATLLPPTTTPVLADALIVMGPKQKLDEKALWVIDQTLMRGIPVAILYDSRNFIPQQFAVGPQDSGLAPLLASYGVKIGQRLVYDAQCETIGLTQSVGTMQFTTRVRYPFVPLISRFDKDEPLMRGIDALGLAFVTTVEPGATIPGLTFKPLVSSSEQSWLWANPSGSVAPNALPQPQPNEAHGPYVLGALVEGVFTSYFQGRMPVIGNTLKGSSPKTQLLVLGTSRIYDPSLPAFTGNEALLANLMAFLSKDEVMLGIRSKGDVIRPLKQIPPRARDFAKFFCILGTPLLAVGFGLWRLRRRQVWRQIIQSAFGGVAAAAPVVPPAPSEDA